MKTLVLATLFFILAFGSSFAYTPEIPLEKIEIHVRKGDYEKVRLFLLKGGNPNLIYNKKADFTLLYHAIQQNQLKMAKLLLDNGANPNPATHHHPYGEAESIDSLKLLNQYYDFSLQNRSKIRSYERNIEISKLSLSGNNLSKSSIEFEQKIISYCNNLITFLKSIEKSTKQ